MFSARALLCLEYLVSALDNNNRRYVLGKIGVDYPLHGLPPELLHQMLAALNNPEEPCLVQLAEDLIRNRQHYRSTVAARYNFDTPREELERILRLDGWEFREDRLLLRENVLVNLQIEEDARLALLRGAGLPNTQTVEDHLNRSAQEYGRDNNNSITNSRQALEQILRDVADLTADARREVRPANEVVRDYLEESGFLTREEKRGISGVYGFLSGAAHPGIIDEEAARLGRNFALGACHYALQKFARWSRAGFRDF
jgi:hypothetical protein